MKKKIINSLILLSVLNIFCLNLAYSANYTFTEKEAERSPFSPCRNASTVQYLIFRRYSLPEIDFVVRRKNFFVLIFFGGVYQLAQKNFR